MRSLRSMLPFSVRQKLGSWKTRRYLREAIEALSPLEVASENLRAEVHMMLGKNHLWRGLAALHTFFGYSGLADRVGVMIHMDGTIGRRGARWLEQHIHGVQLTDYPSSDPRLLALFHDRPNCEEYYRRGLSCMPKLFHVSAFARLDRVVVLDSDIVFWSTPQEIVRWVDGEHAKPMYQRAPRDDIPGPEVQSIFDDVRSHLDSLRGPFEIKDYHFSSGLLLFPVHRMSFDLVEDYFRWHSSSTVTNRPGMYWFLDWTTEMTAYLLNFATWPDAVPLDEKYGMASELAEVCNHYFKGSYYRDDTLLMIRKALEKIASEAPKVTPNSKTFARRT